MSLIMNLLTEHGGHPSVHVAILRAFSLIGLGWICRREGNLPQCHDVSYWCYSVDYLYKLMELHNVVSDSDSFILLSISFPFGLTTSKTSSLLEICS